MPEPDRLPVTLLTGFLGSGKTTLLNRLMRHPLTCGAALIINEFGEIGLDHDLIEAAQEELVLLNNGCLCCTVRSDLIHTIGTLFQKQAKGQIPPFDRIVVETTGLADPAPILHTLMTDQALATRLRLDGIITVVDAVAGLATLDRHIEAAKQAAVADRLLLSKIDLAAPAEVDRLKEKLQAINPAAAILVAHHGEVDPRQVTALGLYDPSRKSLDVQRWLRAETYPQFHPHEHDDHAGPDRGHHHDVNRHDARIRAFCLTLDTPVTGICFDLWIGALMAFLGPDLLRLKGIIHIAGHDRPIVVHGVQHIFHPPVFLKAWPSADRRSRIVFIGHQLDETVIRDTLRILTPSATSTPAETHETGNAMGRA